MEIQSRKSPSCNCADALSKTPLNNSFYQYIELADVGLNGVIDGVETICGFDLPTRAVELSLMQRACPAYISKVDSDEAVRVGNEAVKAALAGKTGNMVILKRLSDKPYKIAYELAPLDSIANEVSQIPQDMMFDKTRMSQKFRDYLAPLIVGEAPVKYENGIALTPKLKRILFTR